MKGDPRSRPSDARAGAVGAAYLETARRELERLRKLAERALTQVDDEAFFREPVGGGNSLAVLVKHMSGNMRSRWTDFLTTDGEKPGRDRDSEFRIEESDTRARLMERWKAGWSLVLEAIRPLRPSDLSRIVRIRGEPFSVLQAIERQLVHYAYHVGQIVQLSRSRAGTSWRTLSIPRGRSEAFNESPDPYLEET